MTSQFDILTKELREKLADMDFTKDGTLIRATLLREQVMGLLLGARNNIREYMINPSTGMPLEERQHIFDDLIRLGVEINYAIYDSMGVKMTTLEEQYEEFIDPSDGSDVNYLLTCKLEDNIGKKVSKKPITKNPKKIRQPKPFKSGFKTNTIKGVTQHPKLDIPCYTFEEDESYVECRRCKILD